jgi:hypothetical protein
MPTPSDADDWEAVQTLEDFGAFLKLLSNACDTGAPVPTSAYLEAFSAWLDASYLMPGAVFAEFRPEPSWREFARMLTVSRSYG